MCPGWPFPRGLAAAGVSKTLDVAVGFVSVLSIRFKALLVGRAILLFFPFRLKET
jgi:hypothetical protein